MNAIANAVRNLVHASNGTVELGSKTQAEILAEMEALGAKIGATSLRELLKGKKDEVGGWKMVEVAAAPSAEVKTDEVQEPANPAFNFPKGADMQKTEPTTPVNIAQMQQDAKNSAPKQLTPEQIALAAAAENAHPTNGGKDLKKVGDHVATIDPTTGKQTFRGTDWSKVLPQAPQPVKDGSMLHRLLVRLCDPKGATKQELMTEFGWSAGGLSGILHWEPKSKGYFLHSEKKDGELRYFLQEIGTGRRYGAEEILVKAPAAPKAPKEPKAPKVQAAAAADASKPVKVSKEQKAQVPNLGAANVTKRVAVKKPA